MTLNESKIATEEIKVIVEEANKEINKTKETPTVFEFMTKRKSTLEVQIRALTGLVETINEILIDKNNELNDANKIIKFMDELD